MKIVFLLDNSEYVEVSPEKLQIRQIDGTTAALGIEVAVPVKAEDGTLELDENGATKVQTGFRPFINYNVTLSVPKPTETVEAKPVVEAGAVKKTKAKRKSN